jgi:trehalose synthase
VSANSTARGGGVAEMLATLLGYARGLGVAVDWVVISGDPEFFAITKRIHNGLYGSPGDGGTLGAAERAHYERVTTEDAELLRRSVHDDDVVLVHDPQPAGLVAPLVELGAVSSGDATSGSTGRTSGRSGPGRSSVPMSRVPTHASSRARHSRPAGSIAARFRVTSPSIDPFAPKNRDLAPVLVVVRASAPLSSRARENRGPARGYPSSFATIDSMGPGRDLLDRTERQDVASSRCRTTLRRRVGDASTS